jgi:3-hydroxyisobutyrate dehydrogenase-like beta-hydroxyacid dehydrogenase
VSFESTSDGPPSPTKPAIGILGTGDMGSAVGRVLKAAGYRVLTALDGRSATSRKYAEAAGLEDLGSLESLLAQSDLFLSILPPAAAFEFAHRAANIVRSKRLELVYADCNAVSPATVDAIAALFTGGGARFADVGIVGPAPHVQRPGTTRLYVSGPERAALLELEVPELGIVDMGDAVGRASALKMCYGGMNKGVNALYATILVAARQLGVDATLWQEFELSQPDAARRMARRIPFLPATAERFTGEMSEIAATFEAVGVTGEFHRGAEWLYRLVAQSCLAGETRLTQPEERSLDAALAAYVDAISNSHSDES